MCGFQEVDVDPCADYGMWVWGIHQVRYIKSLIE